MRIPIQSTSIFYQVAATSKSVRAAVVPAGSYQQSLSLTRPQRWTLSPGVLAPPGGGGLPATCGDVSGQTCWINSEGKCICSDVIVFPPV